MFEFGSAASELRTADPWPRGRAAFDGELLEKAKLTKLRKPLIPAAPSAELVPAAPSANIMRLVAASGTWPTSDQARHQAGATTWLDVSVASIALLFFAPLMGLIALAILLFSPGPVLFRQTRLGLGGRTFSCLKFRTMRHNAAEVLADVLARDPLARAEWESTHKLRRDPRISRLGNFLRKTSLDELPQFFNVLAGDMSIVGPRPIVPEEACRYRRHIQSYYAVKPGITGLWQISGRNHTTYRRRVACDVRYARSRNAYRDIAIIALTVPVVLFARGAY